MLTFCVVTDNTIEQPESGRTNQGQGSTTASGCEDYIDLAGYAVTLQGLFSKCETVAARTWHSSSCCVYAAKEPSKSQPHTFLSSP